MSWSLTFIGHPENVAKALEDLGTKLDGQSKVEFDSAKPHLVGIVKENFAENPPLVKITANGHGYAVDGEQKNRHCVASVEVIYGTLV